MFSRNSIFSFVAVFLFTIVLAGCGPKEVTVNITDGNNGSDLFETPKDNDSAFISDIYGLWGTSMEFFDFTMHMRMRFSPGTLQAANRCDFPGNVSLYVSVTVRADITGSTIRPLERRADKETHMGYECEVEIDSTDAFSYSIDTVRNKLIMVDRGIEMEFDRYSM